MANSSTDVTVPHFDLPFRFLAGSGGVAVVEQDSYEDVAVCVETIVRTPLGFRDDAPSFGITPMEFTNNPSIDSQEIINEEPRVALLTAAQRSALDELVSDLTVKVDQL